MSCFTCKFYTRGTVAGRDDPYDDPPECGAVWKDINASQGDFEQIGLLLQDIMFALAKISACPRYISKIDMRSLREKIK